MQVGLDHSSSSRYPGDSGSDFRIDPEIESSAEASWRSHFDHHTTMATPAGNDTVSNTVSTATAISPNDDITAGQRMVSASAGNILTGLLVTPLDVVRVRLQSQTVKSINPSQYTSHTLSSLKNLPPNIGITACCREVFWVGDNAQMCMLGPQGSAISAQAHQAIDCAVEETQRRTFTSTFDGLRKIARNEGVFALWRGLSPTLMMGIPANIIYFAGYDWLRTDDRSPIKRSVSDVYAPFVAGAIARTAAASATSPVEMFRTRLQATPGTGAGHFKATLQGLHQMTQAQGYASLWRGLSLTMWRDVPFSGLYWWGYEKVKEGLEGARQHAPHLSNSDSEQVSTATAFIDSFIAGATSGSVAALVTTPFDVGKTRQQVYRHMDDHVAPSGPRSTLSPKGNRS
ncbi:uncharacterized protein N7469_003903 [Penicillium citrinum]|uniref:Uncharacterized protein n=1 Tax=Penicillium citrinum TaxID=5077 RepID=A0A9W9P425_PENCI|nr:uncharacterized protein N7469_003903 [Penicillium citrinum]KAJ5234735.1 hypothetical protein N7469_003903 [Penicillium citrinum]